MDNQTQTPSRPMTFGEKLVGLDFNPGANPKVDEVKQNFAAYIDLVHDGLGQGTSEEKSFVIQTAIQDLIRAQMAVVKVVTYKY